MQVKVSHHYRSFDAFFLFRIACVPNISHSTLLLAEYERHRIKHKLTNAVLKKCKRLFKPLAKITTFPHKSVHSHAF